MPHFLSTSTISILAMMFITVSSSNFTVYRLIPETNDQLSFLHKLYLSDDIKLDFWKQASKMGEQAHVMVERSLEDDFLKIIMDHNISYALMIDDVEKKIIKQKEMAEKVKQFNWLKDSPRNRIAFNLAQYHSFADMINYLNALAVTYPDRVQVMPTGTTHEGRQIPLIRIGRPTRANKPAIWIDGGIHAREWVAPAVVLYMINQLVVHYDTDPVMRSYVDNIDWFIVPLLNPDGYEYSRSSTNPEIRLWRKNRSPRVCTQTRSSVFAPTQTHCCQGVDLNRNFDWHFGIEGSSTDPCSEIYQGAYAFSEPETRSVRDFITPRRGQIKAFLTFHSYSQILMYPFGHQVRTYSADVNDLRNTALHAAGALKSLYGTNYVVGTGADTLYPASGGSEDWAKGRMGIKYSYLFELRPEEQVWDGFLLAENQIMPTSRETFEAVKVIASQTLASSGVFSSAPRSDAAAEWQQRMTKKWGRTTGVRQSSPKSRITHNRRNNGRNTNRQMCVDKDSLCGYWARTGACSTYPSMQDRCPRSCGFCGNDNSFFMEQQ